MILRNKLPLCIDLDGTLIRSDVTQENLLIFIRKYPWKILHILFWLYHGRAYLKSKLAEYVTINPELLPYNKKLIYYLKGQLEKGYDLYLVTAADKKCAEIVCNHLKIFKGCMASNAKINLRSSAKAQALCETFGEEGFIYAGNSRHDLAVWRKSAEIIAVNVPQSVLNRAKKFNKQIQVFQDLPLTLSGIYFDLKYYTFLSNLMFISIILTGFNHFKNFESSSMVSWLQNLLWCSALWLNHTSAVLLGMLFQLNNVRTRDFMKKTLYGSGRLTIAQILHLATCLLLISYIVALLLPDPCINVFLFIFICQFLLSTRYIIEARRSFKSLS